MEQNHQHSSIKIMKKIDYVRVVNFQIWKEAILKLDDFNVIKGSSNSGKSSLVRAMNMVLNNDWHKSWLRQDEIDTTVEIGFTDGTKIKRIRGSQNSVEIFSSDVESNTWSGFGNNYPEEVLDFLLINEENCSYQFDQHFFLSLTPTKRALTFGSFSDLQKIDEINLLVQKKIRDGDKLQKSYEMELERLIVEIDKTNSILKVQPAVDLLLKIYDFTNFINKIIGVKDKINDIQEVLYAFDPLEEIDILFKRNEIMLTAIEIQNISDEVITIDNEIKDLQSQIKEEVICPACGQQITNYMERHNEEAT